MKVIRFVLLLVLLSLVVPSCTRYVYREVYPTLLDGKYDSEFPYRGCSRQLEEISESIKRLTALAHYKTYSFDQMDSVTLSDISPELLRAKSGQPTYQQNATAGTATILFTENNRIALLTCAHVISFQDTIVSYHIGEDLRPSAFVKSVSIKTSQLNFLSEVAGGTALEILSVDKSMDLAILGQKLEPQQTVGFKPFMYPFGRGKELEWGSFVYVFGYSSGYKMITKAIVSNPGRPGHASFVIDAVVSPGSSGAIALAIRDGVPSFELVGIVKMIPAQASYILSPLIRSGEAEYDPGEPYRGDVFVERRREIQYGIAQAISAEAVLEFIEKSRSQLDAKGYSYRYKIRSVEDEKPQL